MIECQECHQFFPSKTKLFKHLAIEHNHENVKYNSEKCALCFGWISNTESEVSKYSNNYFLKLENASVQYSTIDPFIEVLLFKVIYCVENSISIENCPDDIANKYPRGYSRCGKSTQLSSLVLGLEDMMHGLCDIISLTLKRIPISEYKTWVNQMNSLLPWNIRIFQRINLLGADSIFNAEISVSQRRYECLIPINILMPFDRIDSILEEYGTDYQKIQTSPSIISCQYYDDKSLQLKAIKFFGCLRNFMKMFTTFSDESQSYHNFCSGTITPNDSCSNRKVHRFYHKNSISLSNSQKWIVLSFNGDDFLKGQISKMMFILLGLVYGWLQVDIIEDLFNNQNITEVPGIPSWLIYLAECKFPNIESKLNNKLFLDPRRCDNEDMKEKDTIKLIDEFEFKLHSNIESYHNRNPHWFDKLELQCMQLKDDVMMIRKLRNRKLILDFPKESINDHFKYYNVVLNLLRITSESGLWPESTTLRQNIIVDGGSSFSVGLYPKPLVSPNGNLLFPELVYSCFQLERILYPNRKPSSTIAINRNAQFKPHKDSGAGNGQSRSLIVALGDFVGGEIMIETKIYDIRYKPIEFDGWSQRHATLPFCGERFSLVWFTPNGISDDEIRDFQSSLKGSQDTIPLV